MTEAAKTHWSVEPRKAIVESVLRQLVSLDDRPEGSYVTTPLLYPSGANVVVRVDAGPHRFLVSDFGMGYHEADLMGATLQFSRHAKAVADSAGVGFDHHAFFVLEVAREQLAGAIIAIANCSHEAVQIAAFKLADKSKSDAADLLYERLVRIFTRDAVTRGAEVRGSSNTPWPVATLVRVENRTAIFEPVAHHHVSIVTAAAKFHDIANLDAPPARNAVVSHKEQFGTYLAVLAQAANVVEREAPDSAFRKSATAA